MRDYKKAGQPDLEVNGQLPDQLNSPVLAQFGHQPCLASEILLIPQRPQTFPCQQKLQAMAATSSHRAWRPSSHFHLSETAHYRKVAASNAHSQHHQKVLWAGYPHSQFHHYKDVQAMAAKKKLTVGKAPNSSIDFSSIKSKMLRKNIVETKRYKFDEHNGTTIFHEIKTQPPMVGKKSSSINFGFNQKWCSGQFAFTSPFGNKVATKNSTGGSPSFASFAGIHGSGGSDKKIPRVLPSTSYLGL